MSLSTPNRPLIPTVLSAGLLVLLVGLAILPNLGLVAASSNCTYGACTANTPPNYSLYYAVLAVLAIVALALGVLLYMRRRSGSGSPGPLTEAEPPAGPPSGEMGAPEAPMVPETTDTAAGSYAIPTVPPGAGGAAYLEGPEDVGAAPPATPALPTPPAGSASAGGEADIDSLMQELDKISGEILKRPPVKKDGGDAASSDEEGTQSG